jgi:hypothetical protein
LVLGLLASSHPRLVPHLVLLLVVLMLVVLMLVLLLPVR